MAKVVIDPGHGGTTAVGDPPSSANNAIGPAGTLEKNWTLDIALKCRDMLARQGVTVLMTRTTDVNIGLYERAHIARDNQADAFVSIHFNGNTSQSIQGTETYVYNDTASTANSFRLAQLVQNSVLAKTGLSNRGVKRDDKGNLNPAQHFAGTAACLVEVSFLTNATEETRLADVNYRNNLAEGIAVAIFDYVTHRFALFEFPFEKSRVYHHEGSIAADSTQRFQAEADLSSDNDDLIAQISAGRIVFDAGKEERLTKELLGQNDGAVKVTEKLKKLVLELSRVIDAGKSIRISDLIRDEGHHGEGRAVDIGNEEIADHLLQVKKIATDAKVQTLEIDELIFKASGATSALQNRWNYDVGVRHDYDAATLAEHANHIHFAVKA